MKNAALAPMQGSGIELEAVHQQVGEYVCLFMFV